MIGQTISHYRVIEKLGGGMGEVYRTRDKHLARDVAIKVLPAGTLSDQSARKRFHKEAREENTLKRQLIHVGASAQLSSRSTPYEYHETAGGHAWDYGDRSVQDLLRAVADVISGQRQGISQ